MKKVFLTSLVTTGMVVGVSAQSIERQEVSTAGNYSTASNVSLSWTLGQPTLVETFTGTNITLTQGFQQVELGTTSVDNAQAGKLLVTVFPNPSSYQFNFTFTTTSNGEMLYRVYDSRGRLLVMQDNIKVESGATMQTIETDGWAQGIYHLEVIFRTAKGETAYQTKLSHIKN